jgi:hypothetical protein
MKPATASPTREALAGLVERVTFHNADFIKQASGAPFMIEIATFAN